MTFPKIMSGILKYVGLKVLAQVGMNDEASIIYHDNGRLHIMYIGDCAISGKRVVAINRGYRTGVKNRKTWI